MRPLNVSSFTLILRDARERAFLRMRLQMRECYDFLFARGIGDIRPRRRSRRDGTGCGPRVR
jgi:hypothetical protein